MKAYVEAILDKNTFVDVGDIILYLYVVMSGLSQDSVGILIALH